MNARSSYKSYNAIKGKHIISQIRMNVVHMVNNRLTIFTNQRFPCRAQSLVQGGLSELQNAFGCGSSMRAGHSSGWDRGWGWGRGLVCNRFWYSFGKTRLGGHNTCGYNEWTKSQQAPPSHCCNAVQPTHNLWPGRSEGDRGTCLRRARCFA